MTIEPFGFYRWALGLLGAAAFAAALPQSIAANAPARAAVPVIHRPGSLPRRYGRLIPNVLNTSGKIAHVIVVVMENRTVDNLLQTVPNVKVTSTCTQQSPATTIPLGPVSLYGQQEILSNPSASPIPTGPMYDPNHRHLPVDYPTPGPTFTGFLPGTGFVADYDLGNNDGWNCASPAPSPLAGATAGPSVYYDGAYVPAADIKPYADLAQKWTVADEVYQANEGPSFVAHQYLIAGQSGAHHNYVAAPTPTPSGSVTPSPTPSPIYAPGTFAEAENPGGGIVGQTDAGPLSRTV